MFSFGTQWERARASLTPAKLRIGLALLTLIAVALAGGAGDHWT
jgi:hypothetical protein